MAGRSGWGAAAVALGSWLLAGGCGEGAPVRANAAAPPVTPAAPPVTPSPTPAVARPLPNLVPLAQDLQPTLTTDTFAPDTCEVAEQCIGAPGTRRLLRFDADFANVGEADLTFGDPAGNPAFAFSPCHGHYHLQGFSAYELLDPAGHVVVTGRKQGFCIRDDMALPGTTAPGRYDCTHQGITQGWVDIYGSTLPCQWIDVTDVPPGDYQLRVRINPDRLFEESSYEDDDATVPVTIPR